MRIGIPTEIRPGETRVAATPETVKKLAAELTKMGCDIISGGGPGLALKTAAELLAGGLDGHEAAAFALALVVHRARGELLLHDSQQPR